MQAIYKAAASLLQCCAASGRMLVTEGAAYGVLHVAATVTGSVAVARLSGRVLGALLHAGMLHERLLEAYETWRAGPVASTSIVRDTKMLAVSCSPMHCAR